MSDITRIMDLPENVTMQMNTNGDRSSGLNNSYSPMDVHPNPYGHPPPSVPSMPTPTSTGPSQMQMQILQVIFNIHKVCFLCDVMCIGKVFFRYTYYLQCVMYRTVYLHIHYYLPCRNIHRSYMC